jgi:hypothetical protein
MKLTTAQCLQLRLALLALDGLDTVHDVNGRAVATKKPFKLTGKVRMRLGRNLRAVEAVAQEFDAARTAKIRELSGGGETVPADKQAQFRADHDAMLNEEHEVALTPIPEDDLNLDENAIAHAALAVLDQFVISPDPVN